MTLARKHRKKRGLTQLEIQKVQVKKCTHNVLYTDTDTEIHCLKNLAQAHTQSQNDYSFDNPAWPWASEGFISFSLWHICSGVRVGENTELYVVRETSFVGQRYLTVGETWRAGCWPDKTRSTSAHVFFVRYSVWIALQFSVLGTSVYPILQLQLEMDVLTWRPPDSIECSSSWVEYTSPSTFVFEWKLQFIFQFNSFFPTSLTLNIDKYLETCVVLTCTIRFTHT